MSHPVWVRGLKHSSRARPRHHSESHPVWVRGLKRSTPAELKTLAESHPVWVRGLKHRWSLQGASQHPGRTPCGCVD